MKSLLSIVAIAVLALSSSFAEDVKTTITAAGEKIATTATQPLAFHGAPPVAQRSGAAQTALTDSTGGSTANATLSAVTAPSALTDSSGGSASTTLASISDTATKNAVASLAARQAEDRAAIVALTDAVAKEAKLINELRAALVEKGLIKGSN
jgi:hypothetical protein